MKMNKEWEVEGIPIKRRYQYISIYDGVRQEWCPLNLVVNDLQDELVSTKNRRDELIKQLEDLEHDKIDEHYQQILENKKIVTPWKRLDVAEDLAPLFSALVGIFEEFYDESEYQYKNNLLMLRYHVKGFKEACKE